MKTSRKKTLAQFGAAVREERLRLEVSQEELGFRSGLDRTYISGIERGVRNPSLTAILTIANGLGIKAADLLRHMDK